MALAFFIFLAIFVVGFIAAIINMAFLPLFDWRGWNRTWIIHSLCIILIFIGFVGSIVTGILWIIITILPAIQR